MTPSELQAATGCTPENAQKWAQPIADAMAKHGIDTPQRQAAFIAQIAHESGRFKWVRELWGPTPAQLRYEGRQDLGNLSPGDGKKYMGRGLIQVTGKDNYRRLGAAIGIDLVSTPQRLEEPQLAADSAGWFWETHGCNDLADAGELEKLTRRINGGLNGLTDRYVLYDQAKRVLGV